jgi:hypothetical protein
MELPYTHCRGFESGDRRLALPEFGHLRSATVRT